MSPFLHLAGFFAVDVLAVVSPGPAFLAATQLALRHGPRSGFLFAVGLTVAALGWCLVAILGLGTLFRVFPWVYGLLKLLSGIYLLYLGVRLWRGGVPTVEAGVQGHGFVKGILVGLTNPKAIVYFGSIFTLFITPDAPVWFSGAAMVVAGMDTLLWFSIVAVVFSRSGPRRIYLRCGHWIGRGAGGVMALFGGRLLLLRD